MLASLAIQSNQSIQYNAIQSNQSIQYNAIQSNQSIQYNAIQSRLDSMELIPNYPVWLALA